MKERGRIGLRHQREKTEKFATVLPASLLSWLRQKAETEGKTISLLLTEILETARQKDEEKGTP